MKITRQSYLSLEKNEESGKITMEKLAQAAEAMDCELVYAIRPKRRVKFSQIIWDKLLEVSLKHHWVKSRPQHTKVNALLAISQFMFENSEFRRKNQWSERIKTKGALG